MSEITLQWIQLVKLMILAGFAMLYGFGGVSGKWKRRVIGPIIYTAGLCGISLWTDTFNAWYLLCAPLLYGALSIGYGATNISEKIRKRSLYGLACAIASLPVFWTGAWTLLGLHIAICIATSVVAGVWNQTSSARSEETLIGAAIILVPLFTI